MRSPPDGYTLWWQPANAINATLSESQFQFHPGHRAGRGRDRVSNVMEVNPSFPAKSVPEFIAYAKANPARSTWLGRKRKRRACRRRTVQDDDRRRHDPRTLSRRGASAERPDRRSGAGHVRAQCRLHRAHSLRQVRALAVTTATRSKCCRTFRRGRIRTGLRGQRVVWDGCAEGHAGRRSSTNSMPSKSMRRWLIPTSRRVSLTWGEP